jgi:hypothetical protein
MRDLVLQPRKGGLGPSGATKRKSCSRFGRGVVGATRALRQARGVEQSRAVVARAKHKAFPCKLDARPTNRRQLPKVPEIGIVLSDSATLPFIFNNLVALFFVKNVGRDAPMLKSRIAGLSWASIAGTADTAGTVPRAFVSLAPRPIWPPESLVLVHSARAHSPKKNGPLK